MSSSELDASEVSRWLDANPEFLNEYLKKLQAKQRCDNIFNSEFMTKTPVTSVVNTARSPTFLSSYLGKSNRRSYYQSPQYHYNRNSPMFKSAHHPRASPANTTSPVTINISNSQHIKLNPSMSEPNMTTNDVRIQCDNSLTGQRPVKGTLSRTKFKHLGLYEKMYTLVKTLYQSLDLKITCKKILNTVSLLLDADRCSLFLVVDEDGDNLASLTTTNSIDISAADNPNSSFDLGDQVLAGQQSKKFLVSVVFDAKSNSSLANNNEEDCPDEQIKIPYGVGIAGYVASTKQAVNIENAYADPRFNDTIDQKTGYRTRSILCLPILNENGDCIAVAEAINKREDFFNSGEDDESTLLATPTPENANSDAKEEKKENCFFTKEDEDTFSKFMPFISIAIRNSNLYAQSRREAQTNKVLLELATMVFDESSSTVDNLVSRILFNSLYLLECEKCQIVLLNRDKTDAKSYNQTLASPNSLVTRRRNSIFNNINKQFDRVYELAASDLATHQANSLVAKEPSFAPNSPELDVIQSVIKSGEVRIVRNENGDQLFDPSVRSLLCIPVVNNDNQPVAILFAINKIPNRPPSFSPCFSKQDINIAQTFALFCGIGIQNIMMYEKVVQAMTRQQVALDVLSFHVASNQEDVNRLLQESIPEPTEFGLRSFLFDENTLDDIGTLKACISMFGELGFIEQFQIPYEVLCRFFLTVKKNYRPVAYHNWRHGFNVMSAMYTMVTTGNYKDLFNNLEIFALLIACICHDVDHRGTSNKFQLKIQSPLAKLYSTSTMEHHHFNQCIIILHNTNCNILANLTQSQHSTAIDIIEKSILATDLSLHFKHFDKFLEKANSEAPRFDAPDDKELLMNILMTACDLSGAAKSWRCHYRLSNLVANEFFNEGDLEKEKFKNEPIDQMNRNKSDKLPQMQIQFLQGVCHPLYLGLSKCNPALKEMVDQCESNMKEWRKLIIADNVEHDPDLQSKLEQLA